MFQYYSVRGAKIAYSFVTIAGLSHVQSALFLLSSHYGPTVLTQDRFIAAFRRALSATGLPNASSYRGHSFRRGAASWAFNHGVPSELIRIYGDWASDAYKAYLEFGVESKLAFAQQLRSAVLSTTSQLLSAPFVYWAFCFVAERFIRLYRWLLFTFCSYP